MNPHRSNPLPLRAGGTAAGLFDRGARAERAIRELKYAGFKDNQIGVLVHDGAVLGGVVGLLTGIGALAIPGIGPLVAGGALASTLARAGTGAAAEGLVGALVGMGLAEEDARHYERGLHEGAILVTVDAGPKVDDAHQILLTSGADFGPSAGEPAGGTGTGERIELHEEERRAIKEPVRTGEVRGRREAVPEKRNLHVPERRRPRDPGYAGPERRVVTRRARGLTRGVVLLP